MALVLSAHEEIGQPTDDAAEEDDEQPDGLVATVHAPLRLVEVPDEVDRYHQIEDDAYEWQEGGDCGRGVDDATEHEQNASSDVLCGVCRARTRYARSLLQCMEGWPDVVTCVTSHVGWAASPAMDALFGKDMESVMGALIPSQHVNIS